MKRIIITILAVAGFYGFSQAQTAPVNEFGVFASVGSSYVTAGNNVNSSSLLVFNAGLSAEHYFSDRWSLKVKALYDQKGWSDGFITVPTSSGSGTVATTSVDYKLNYITVPVMANWHFGRTRNWFLNFGPYVGFLVSASAKGPGVNLADAQNYFNNTDAGLGLGIGIKFPISATTKFYIELDGQGGVTNISKGNSGSAVQNERSGLSVGVNF